MSEVLKAKAKAIAPGTINTSGAHRYLNPEYEADANHIFEVTEQEFSPNWMELVGKPPKGWGEAKPAAKAKD